MIFCGHVALADSILHLAPLRPEAHKKSLRLRMAAFLDINGYPSHSERPETLLAVLDGIKLREQVQRARHACGWSQCGRMYRLLEQAASHPSVDIDGAFAKTFHAVPRQVELSSAWMVDLPVGLLRLCGESDGPLSPNESRP